MRNTMKRTLSAMIALAMILCMMGALTVSADDAFTAKLGFADTAWGAQEWGDNANVSVTGDGTYTISWDIPEGGTAAIDAGVFVIDIVGAQAALNAENKTFDLSALTVTADGVDIPVKINKVVTGDLEQNGNFRIEIYNQYGSTATDQPIDPASVVFASNLTVTFTIAVIDKPTYVANLGFADTAWGAQEWGENANVTVMDDGAYTISWNIPEGGTAAIDAGVFVIDLVGAQAALNAKDKTYQVSELTVSADGVDIPVDLSKVVTGDVEKNGNFRIEIYNQYGSTATDAPIDPASVVFASNLTINFTLKTVNKPTYTANLGFADTAWGAQEWGENANVTVVDDGEYTISWDIPEGGTAAIDAGVFVIDLIGAQAKLNENNKTYNVTALTVTADGVDIPVDLSKIVAGDIEENGNFRIEIYNQYGSTSADAPIDPAAVKFASNLTVTFSLETVKKSNESAEEYYFFIAIGGDKDAEGDWGLSYDDTAAVEGITAVTATGKSGDTVTISLTFDKPVLNVYYIAPCLVGTGAGQTIGVIDMDVVCKVDGVEIPVNMAANAQGKTWWAEGTGGYVIEDCIRLAGTYNEWGDKFIEKPTGFTTIEYVITLNSIQIAEVEEEEVVIPELDPNGTYEAYLVLQSPNWSFRNAWNDAAYGMEGTSWGEGEAFGPYLTHTDHPGETYGVITDATIAGNGTYSVKLTDFGSLLVDDFANNTDGRQAFNILAVATNIPQNDQIKITDIQFYVDGQLKHKEADAFMNPDDAVYMSVLLQNKWNPDKAEISYYAAPAESLEIKFTVSGFAYDKAADTEPEVTPTEPQPSGPQATEPAASEPAASEPAATEPAAEEEKNNDNLVLYFIAAILVITGIAAGAAVVIQKKKAK